MWVTLVLGLTDGELVGEIEGDADTLLHVEGVTVTHAEGVVETEKTALPELTVDAERAPVLVVNKLGVCVGDKEPIGALGLTEAVAERDDDAVSEGENDGEPEGERVRAAEPVRRMLSVDTGEKEGDTEAVSVVEVHTEPENVTEVVPEVLHTGVTENDTLGLPLLVCTFDGVGATVMVTVRLELTLPVPHAVA